MAVWGGVECTVNRIHDEWHDQLALSGHASRIADLDLIAEIGLRTLRFPLLWERTVDASGVPNWEWSDQRLMRLRELGIRPIIGLVHHGSGPGFTNLLDESFAPRLADFAAAVAARYPWVTDYTPINEPLTTARFSALYGYWYPHRRDNASFCRAFLNQCRGIVLAMRAIRAVNPEARLIQTEDLGTTYSTPHMAYQREFDNERRWLSWDLLSGMVGREHPLAGFFLQSACTWSELDWFSHNSCPPDVIGINHYVTSDRFLDECTAKYAGEPSGSNSIDAYVDVPAVRVIPGAYRGWQVLEVAWRRYRTPLALTEVHLGCTREEQLRWFQEAWNAAEALRHRGGDVIAVTSWSLFGSYNWNNLLTQATGSYEPGAFDCRSSFPRPTAVAHMLRRLCANLDAVHPTMRFPGWWQRPSKLTYLGNALPPHLDGEVTVHHNVPCLVVVGSDGPLARALIQACQQRHLLIELISHGTLVALLPLQMESLRRQGRPWAIIDADSSLATLHDWLLYESVALAGAPAVNVALSRSHDCVTVEVFAGEDARLTPPEWARLADACLDLLIDEAEGLYQVSLRNTALSSACRVDSALRRRASAAGQRSAPRLVEREAIVR